MKKLKLFLVLIALLSLVPLLGILMLYYAKLERITYDFRRNIDYRLKNARRYQLPFNSYYIAGASGAHIYLANYTSTGLILRIDTALNDTLSFRVNFEKKDLQLKSGNYRLRMDTSTFYFYSGVARSILIGNIKDWKAHLYEGFSPFFQELIQLSPKSYVYQFVNANSNQTSLRKENRSGKRTENNNLLKKQVDGVFCTAGMLDYNPKLSLLVYLYYYRNEILLVDTNLNLVRKIKTIDPVDSAKFSVSTIKSNSSKVLTSTSLLVNAKCALWKHYVFVQSKLMGEKEDEARFKSSSVIDIYDMNKGVYISSFYLPNYDKSPITQFRIIGDFIYTLSDNFITRYSIFLPED